MLIAILSSVLIALIVIIALLVVIVHLLYLMSKDRKPSVNILVVWLSNLCPAVHVATKEESQGCCVPKGQCGAKKVPDEYPECPAFGSYGNGTAAPRKRRPTATLCITGVEQPYSFEQHLQGTRSAVVVATSRYIPREWEKQQMSTKAAICRSGDSGFQTRSNKASGNNDGSDSSDNSDVDDPHLSEGEQLPDPTACQGNGAVQLDSDHDSLPSDIFVDQGTLPGVNGPCIERETLAKPRLEGSKQTFGLKLEAAACFQSPDQVSPADIDAEDEGESVEDGKTGYVNSEKKMMTVDEGKAENMTRMRMEAEAEREGNGEVDQGEGDTEVEDKGIGEADQGEGDMEVEGKGNGEVAQEEGDTKVEDKGNGVVDQGEGDMEVEGKGNGEVDQDKGQMEAGSKGKTKTAGKRTKAGGKMSGTKRSSNLIPGQSNVEKVPAGATAQKQPIANTLTTAIRDTSHQQLEGKLLPSSTPESDQSKDSEKKASLPKGDDDPPASPDKGSATSQPASGHCSRREPRTEVGEPPPVPRAKDFQDMATIENECCEVEGEGQPMQLLMVHMEPHDYDLPPPSHPRGNPHLPFPAQESDEGRGKLSLLVWHSY